jgi:hypothetical protein
VTLVPLGSGRLSELRRTNYPIYYRDLDRLDKLFPEQSALRCPLNLEGILGTIFLVRSLWKQTHRRRYVQTLAD